MSRVFFTSDLHFGHERLCKNIRKMSSEESDALIIKNWNRTIKKRDIVYVLGDFVMECPKNIADYVKKLNGEIRIVGGNHDDKKCCKVYSELGIPVLGVLEYRKFVCTHIPIHPEEVQYYRGNIHGHIHTKLDRDTNELYIPEGYGDKYFNVNIELNNYTPVLFENILKYYE